MEKAIIKAHKKSDSPFTILENEEGKFLISLGNQVVSEITFDTLDQAESYIYEKPWELILNSIMYLIQYNENYNKTENSNK